MLNNSVSDQGYKFWASWFLFLAKWQQDGHKGLWWVSFSMASRDSSTFIFCCCCFYIWKVVLVLTETKSLARKNSHMPEDRPTPSLDLHWCFQMFRCNGFHTFLWNLQRHGDCRKSGRETWPMGGTLDFQPCFNQSRTTQICYILKFCVIF